tara:strand:+ start:607 stop:819 length:213 start_codon:yes stop_codon:yes gene_type:complete
MKAIIKYKNGWILEIPTIGTAPMLLLEWISEFRMGKMPIDKVINSDKFQIRFNIPKAEIEKCAEYINANL